MNIQELAQKIVNFRNQYGLSGTPLNLVHDLFHAITGLGVSIKDEYVATHFDFLCQGECGLTYQEFITLNGELALVTLGEEYLLGEAAYAVSQMRFLAYLKEAELCMSFIKDLELYSSLVRAVELLENDYELF
jgi:hypothetical protein